MMLDYFVELLYRYPSACRDASSGLSFVAGIALICGAYAHIGTIAASIATGIAGQPPVSRAAQLFPGIWTWWVPESWAGVLFYGVTFAAGALLALTANKVQRQLWAL